jgi:hypothetical protein
MNRRHWRETVEIVGIVSIVTSLLLVAWEIHRANGIAAAALELDLALGMAELPAARAAAPEFARIYPKLGSPEGHLITATEASQTRGLARQIVETYRAAQIAYDRGLLDDARLAVYVADLAGLLQAYPGLIPYLRSIHETDPELRTMPVFQPLRDLDERTSAAGPSD